MEIWNTQPAVKNKNLNGKLSKMQRTSVRTNETEEQCTTAPLWCQNVVAKVSFYSIYEAVRLMPHITDVTDQKV